MIIAIVIINIRSFKILDRRIRRSNISMFCFLLLFSAFSGSRVGDEDAASRIVATSRKSASARLGSALFSIANRFTHTVMTKDGFLRNHDNTRRVTAHADVGVTFT